MKRLVVLFWHILLRLFIRQVVWHPELESRQNMLLFRPTHLLLDILVMHQQQPGSILVFPPPLSRPRLGRILQYFGFLICDSDCGMTGGSEMTNAALFGWIPANATAHLHPNRWRPMWVTCRYGRSGRFGYTVIIEPAAAIPRPELTFKPIKTENLSKWRRALRHIRRAEIFSVGFPMAMWGFINHLVPFLLVPLLNRYAPGSTEDQTPPWLIPTLIWGIVLFPFTYVLQILLMALFLPWYWAVLYAFVLPHSGFFALLYWQYWIDGD